MTPNQGFREYDDYKISEYDPSIPPEERARQIKEIRDRLKELAEAPVDTKKHPKADKTLLGRGDEFKNAQAREGEEIDSIVSVDIQKNITFQKLVGEP